MCTQACQDLPTLLYEEGAAVCTHGQQVSDGVLRLQDEGTPVPEGQSIGQVDHQEGEAHGDVRGDGLLHSYVLGVPQVLVVSEATHVHQWECVWARPADTLSPDKCHVMSFGNTN